MLRWKPWRKPHAANRPNLEGHSRDQKKEFLPVNENANPIIKNEHTKDDSTEDQKAQTPVDEEMETVMSKMSSLVFVPPSVRFGRGGSRSGLNR